MGWLFSCRLVAGRESEWVGCLVVVLLQGEKVSGLVVLLLSCCRERK